MPKYWEGNYFTHGSFPEVGKKQKTEKEKKQKEKKKERLNDGNNNGQPRTAHASHLGQYTWCTQAAWVNCSLFLAIFLGQ